MGRNCIKLVSLRNQLNSPPLPRVSYFFQPCRTNTWKSLMWAVLCYQIIPNLDSFTQYKIIPSDPPPLWTGEYFGEQGFRRVPWLHLSSEIAKPVPKGAAPNWLCGGWK